MSFANSRLLTNTITISRQSKNELGQFVYTDTGTKIKCVIIPFDDKDVPLGSEAQGQEHIVYLPYGSDIRVADNITDQDGFNYTVDGISEIRYGRETNWHIRISANRQRKRI